MYKIRYKTKEGKWKDHTYKYSDRPILYKTKKNAIMNLRNKYRLVYMTNKIKIVKVKK